MLLCQLSFRFSQAIKTGTRLKKTCLSRRSGRVMCEYTLGHGLDTFHWELNSTSAIYVSMNQRKLLTWITAPKLQSKTPILALLTNVSNSPSRVETSKRQAWKIAPKSLVNFSCLMSVVWCRPSPLTSTGPRFVRHGASALGNYLSRLSISSLVFPGSLCVPRASRT